MKRLIDDYGVWDMNYLAICCDIDVEAKHVFKMLAERYPDISTRDIADIMSDSIRLEALDMGMIQSESSDCS